MAVKKKITEKKQVAKEPSVAKKKASPLPSKKKDSEKPPAKRLLTAEGWKRQLKKKKV